tara:strand:- start:537 stop:698 length:162 start_codon:yes stop_codon:yes gene_type:complete
MFYLQCSMFYSISRLVKARTTRVIRDSFWGINVSGCATATGSSRVTSGSRTLS